MRILILPHAPATPLRTRSLELGRALAASGHQVDVYALELQPPDLSKMQKIIWHGKQATTLQREKLGRDFHRVFFPAWYRDPYGAKVIGEVTNRIVQKRRYDLIISAAVVGWMPPKDTRLVFDLVDDHAYMPRRQGQKVLADKIEANIASQIERADVVTASSLVLCDLVKEKYMRDAVLVANGYDALAYAGVTPAPKPANPIIGYTGGLDNWFQFAPLLAAVQGLRNDGIDARLRLVGGGERQKEFPTNDWLSVTGYIAPEEVPAEVAQFSVGTIPFELSPLTHAALPLKALEYGACQVPCVSTPLAELERQGLPWVHLVPMDATGWREALMRALGTSWQSAWNDRLAEFAWHTGAARLLAAL